MFDVWLFEIKVFSNKKFWKLGLEYFGGEDMEYFIGELF